MAIIKIKDNLICAVFEIQDITRIKVAVAGNEVKQVFVKTFNGAVFEADAEFYRYCLERMTELNIFIEVESSIWLANLDVKYVGSAINASLITGKPTLKHLGQLYALNAVSRRPYGQRLRYLLDKAVGRGSNQADVARFLRKHGVRVVFRKDPTGNVLGVHFIDNATRVVYNGQDLGKKYTAEKFLETFEQLSSEQSNNLNLSREDGRGIENNAELQADQQKEKALLPAQELATVEIFTDTLYYPEQQQKSKHLVLEKKKVKQKGMGLSR